MNVEIGTETQIFLFWEYLFRTFGILSLQCNRNGSLWFNWISGGVSKSSGSNEYSHPIQGTFSYSVESGRFYISGTTIDLFLYELHLDTQTETGFPLKNIQGTFEYG